MRLIRYWKPLAVLALVVFACGFGGGWHMSRLIYKASEADRLAESIKAVNSADKRADEADARLRAEQKKRPKAGPVIRDVVRENPSDCRVPGPVDDGMRKAIRGANASAR